MEQLIEQYLAGPALVREAIAGMTPEQLAAAPVPGKWSTRQVICHLVDFESIGMDRIKLAIATDRPPLPAGFHEAFTQTLGYDDREIETDLRMMEAIRGHMAAVLRLIAPDAWTRIGIHSQAGELTVQQLVERITNHIPHHLAFVAEKRKALGI